MSAQSTRDHPRRAVFAVVLKIALLVSLCVLFVAAYETNQYEHKTRDFTKAICASQYKAFKAVDEQIANGIITVRARLKAAQKSRSDALDSGGSVKPWDRQIQINKGALSRGINLQKKIAAVECDAT